MGVDCKHVYPFEKIFLLFWVLEYSVYSIFQNIPLFLPSFRFVVPTVHQSTIPSTGVTWYPVSIFCWFQCRLCGEHSKCRPDGGIEKDAVYITLPFVHYKAFSQRPRLFDEWYSILYRRVRLLRRTIYCTQRFTPQGSLFVAEIGHLH